VDDDAARLLTGEAWSTFCERLRAAGLEILGEAYPDEPRARAEGFRALTRLVAAAFRAELEGGNPTHPCLVRYEEPFTQWGGPNPDNVYLRAAVGPGATYRVWGDVRGVRAAIFSLHEGDMQLGRAAVCAETTLDRLTVDDDGTLDLLLGGPAPAAGNWMPLDPAACLLVIRIFQSDWEHDATPPFFIERVGAEGVPPPPAEPAAVARALARAGEWVERSLAFWNAYTRAAWERGTPNVATLARAVPGGADDIRYGSCPWRLGTDEVLLVTCEPPEARYWGFTIHTLGWLESGDFVNRQTSLNGHQAHRDVDGRVRLVLAAADPGVPNWIDTEERPRGLLVYRWVWTRTSPTPEATVLPRAALRDHLPADHPAVDAAERRRRLAHRRALAWRRYL
jgi:Protein of unknown function (DUF1214)